jgi:hypothetical protein
MAWTRTAVAVLGVIYVVLWVLAANGATSLVGPLVIPLVLGVLVAGGVALNRFLGTSPRSPRFAERPGIGRADDEKGRGVDGADGGDRP